MPELKNTFTGGKMEKDRDERIVGSGLYREALNIEVSTSEDSEVGAAQNILGNIQVTSAIAGPPKDYYWCTFVSEQKGRYDGTNSHIAHVVDPQNDKLYRFIATDGDSHGVWMDRVVEYNTKSKIEDPWQLKERAVMVDIYKVATTINSVDAGPPTPPTPLFYGCYNGVCTDCASDPNACNTPGQVIYGEATCGGSCSAAVVPGCTDPLYVEFNIAATVDDGSCLTLLAAGDPGCGTRTLAGTYNHNVTTGNTIINKIIQDPTQHYFNGGDYYWRFTGSWGDVNWTSIYLVMHAATSSAAGATLNNSSIMANYPLASVSANQFTSITTVIFQSYGALVDFFNAEHSTSITLGAGLSTIKTAVNANVVGYFTSGSYFIFTTQDLCTNV